MAGRVPRELRARRPAGRASSTLDEQVRAYWGTEAWTCQLCGEAIPTDVPAGHPRSWSKDHIVRLADGGGNDLANLQPSHLVCNKRGWAGPRSVTQRDVRPRTSREW